VKTKSVGTKSILGCGLNANKILFVELIGLGAVNRVSANPSDVFRMAIYKMIVRMVLVHNHPSGNLEPSKKDLDFTDHMLKAGKLISIEVTDHLIISETGYLSLADRGIIKQLQKSGLFEIVDREKVELKQWKLDTERREGEKSKALKIAKKMKDEGMDKKLIKKMTGLYMHEINKL